MRAPALLPPALLTCCGWLLAPVSSIHPECRFHLEIQEEEMRCAELLRTQTEKHKACSGVWDNITCWRPADVGETVTVPCPKLFSNFYSKPGNISKNCTSDGWSETFPDFMDACGYSDPEDESKITFYILVKAIYTLGYSASLISLTTGSIILCLFSAQADGATCRKRSVNAARSSPAPRPSLPLELTPDPLRLVVGSEGSDTSWSRAARACSGGHCTTGSACNGCRLGSTFHLLTPPPESCGLQAEPGLGRDLRAPRAHRPPGDPEPRPVTARALTRPLPMQVGCKLSLVFFQYCIMANFYWLLVEGLYLHTLLVVIFAPGRRFWAYLLIGWGIPTVSTGAWVAARLLLEDTGCWDTSDHSVPWWVIRTPILISIIVNFIFFVSIIRILRQKLTSPDVGSNDQSQYKRLAKSTLLLIPLFGVHYMVFAVFPIGISSKYQILFELCLGSFQGLVVAVLYCFLNSEVQSELRRTWRGLWPSRPSARDRRLHSLSISRTGSDGALQGSRAPSLLQTETSVI
nr:vasoactive intestinal polypeptide receptor 2 [Odocoileus virginianus texanus]